MTAVRPPTLATPTPRDPLRRRERAQIVGALLDAAGGVLLLLVVVWATVVAEIRGGSAGPVRGLALALAAAYLTARLAARRDPRYVPAIVALTSVLVAGLSGPSLLDSPGGPFGYANATAAFYMLAASAAAMVALTGPGRPLTRAAWAVAAGGAVVPWLLGAMAAAVGTLVVAGAVAAVASGFGARRSVLLVAGLGVVLASHAAAFALGSVCPDPASCRSPVGVTALLSVNRPLLWGDAVDLLRSTPGTGVGPGGFGAHSTTASADQDLRYAHSALLQVGAELGWPGLSLAVALLAWPFLRLAAAPSRTLSVIAAAGTTAVLLQASVDYVLHVPVVTLTAAALIGTATGARRRASPRSDTTVASVTP